MVLLTNKELSVELLNIEAILSLKNILTVRDCQILREAALRIKRMEVS